MSCPAAVQRFRAGATVSELTVFLHGADWLDKGEEAAKQTGFAEYNGSWIELEKYEHEAMEKGLKWCKAGTGPKKMCENMDRPRASRTQVFSRVES